jgi:hypothetical protein
VYHHDRETDDELWTQAHGYGTGIALLYERYPDRLHWGRVEQARRIRLSGRRRVGGSVAQLGRVMGFVRDDDAEFAAYLANWDRWFWRGFGETRGLRAAGPSATPLAARP